MITLNRIAEEVYDSAKSHDKINWCTSKMAIICRISVLWRKLAEVDRGFGVTKNREIKMLVAGIVEQLCLLLYLCGEKDIEEVLKENIHNDIYDNNLNE